MQYITSSSSHIVLMTCSFYMLSPHVFYWHCPHSMQSKVYAAVGRPSVYVCLSHCSRNLKLKENCSCRTPVVELAVLPQLPP